MSDDVIDDGLVFTALDQDKTKDWDILRRIRSKCPVLRPSEGLIFTARFEETQRVFKDAKTFSSVGDMRAPGVTVPLEETFLGEIDAPLHPKIRRLLLPGFTPQAAKDSEAWTRANVRRRLRAIKEAGGADLMADLATILPGAVAAHELGIPDEMHDQVMVWANELLHSTWVSHGHTERGVGLEGAFPEMSAYLDGLIAERLVAEDGEAPSDLLTIMVRSADRDGWRLDPQHARTLAVNVIAGSLSASYMLGNLLYRLLTDRFGFAEKLRGDRGLIPAAVEESLRFEAPVLFLFRTAKVDVEIGGCPIHQGEHVMMGIGSSGRDEAVYENANEFRLDRVDPQEHLAFGAGPHLCLGNHLTRMVGRIMMEEVLDVFPDGTLELAPDFEWECVNHIMEYGPERLEVVCRG
jgi:cytochrome P450